MSSTLSIPPLREQVEDILPLFRHFVQVYNHVYHKEVTHIAREAESLLLGHNWEGNVRELKNTVKCIIPFKTNDTIAVEDFSTTIVGGTCRRKNKLVTLEENEMDYILKVLKITGFNITRSAGILGITRARLYRKINQLDLKEAVAPEMTLISTSVSGGHPAARGDY